VEEAWRAYCLLRIEALGPLLDLLDFSVVAVAPQEYCLRLTGALNRPQVLLDR